MARAQLALGTHGSVSIAGQRKDGVRWVSEPDKSKATRYRATTRYRAKDGTITMLERYGKSKGEARAKINRAIADHEQEQELRATRHTRITLADAAATWRHQVERDKGLSERTRKLYLETWARCLEGSELVALPLHEANTVPTLRPALQAIADERGSATAKSVRSVLSNILQLALDDGLVTTNACRSLRPIKAKHERKSVRDTRRALTRDERRHLLEVADEHEGALLADVADVIAFMAGTGVRISEALSLRWDGVDLDGMTAHVKGTKTTGSDRLVPLPEWLAERLRARLEARSTGAPWVFPSPEQRDLSKPRDRRNVARIMREVFDAAGLPWAVPHSLRRTAATLALEAGRPVTEAAQLLGHADPAMTLRVYSAKRPEPNRAVADALAL